MTQFKRTHHSLLVFILGLFCHLSFTSKLNADPQNNHDSRFTHNMDSNEFLIRPRSLSDPEKDDNHNDYDDCAAFEDCDSVDCTGSQNEDCLEMSCFCLEMTLVFAELWGALNRR